MDIKNLNFKVAIKIWKFQVYAGVLANLGFYSFTNKFKSILFLPSCYMIGSLIEQLRKYFPLILLLLNFLISLFYRGNSIKWLNTNFYYYFYYSLILFEKRIFFCFLTPFFLNEFNVNEAFDQVLTFFIFKISMNNQ